ncbi:MAG: hypothetical protein A2V52_05855 [Actinobacteria bacterium RBG_19FT_COMBO_54_7]|nr:MAG: hypothetical protein A2V52_05855 [Actinobacteria bacterium RBG_19FT_COMBO_54_7]
MGCSAAEAEANLETLFHRGVIFKSHKPDGMRYRLCRDIAQFHDASILWPEAPREFLELWKLYTQVEWPEYAKMISQILPKPFARVVTVQQPVDARSRILGYEDVEDIVMKATSLAVVNCTCRLVDGKCGKPVEVCLQIGKGAKYTLERGTGREVNQEEAMEIIRRSEEAGLVHVVMNKSDDSHFICNCCEDCCITLGLAAKFGFVLCDPSRFQAVVDKDKCSGCGTCADRCFFAAIGISDEEAGNVSSVAADKCMGCGLCVVTCPEEAISMVEVRKKDFIPS